MKHSLKKILFLDIMADDSEAKKESEEKITKGPYSDLFWSQIKSKDITMTVVDASQEALPASNKYDGVIIGGSMHNPVAGEEKPWMKRVYSFIQKTVRNKIPMLGVCAGHQFMARALGQEVIYNPQGREMGTIEITLTKDGKRDPLFQGLPKKFKVQLSHRCIVKGVKPQWKLLATSLLCRVQAAAINDCTRIVQFHPEFKAEHIKAIARSRKANLKKEGFFSDEKEFQKFLSSIRESPLAARILQNFVKYFIKKE